MNALLELDGVDVIFRQGSRTFQALHEVNLALFAGERVGLVGGSGSGKTLNQIGRASCRERV